MTTRSGPHDTDSHKRSSTKTNSGGTIFSWVVSAFNGRLSSNDTTNGSDGVTREKMGHSVDPESMGSLVGHVGPSERRAIKDNHTSEKAANSSAQLVGSE